MFPWPPCSAQTAGTVVGRVTDPSKSAIPQAKVELVNENTGIAATAPPSAEGDFVFARLEPGTYRLTVSAEGFNKVVRRGITLLVNQTARVDVELEVGKVATSVEVDARAAMVQSETSSVGNVVDGNQVKTMPLNGRTSIYGLMAHGARGATGGLQPRNRRRGIPGRHGQTVDGVSNDDAIGERLLGQIPSLDSVSEFKVIANAAPAEFGKSAQVIMASKSGGNELHGSLFEFNRNAVARRQSAQRADHRQAAVQSQ